MTAAMLKERVTHLLSGMSEDTAIHELALDLEESLSSTPWTANAHIYDPATWDWCVWFASLVFQQPWMKKLKRAKQLLNVRIRRAGLKDAFGQLQTYKPGSNPGELLHHVCSTYEKRMILAAARAVDSVKGVVALEHHDSITIEAGAAGSLTDAITAACEAVTECAAKCRIQTKLVRK